MADENEDEIRDVGDDTTQQHDQFHDEHGDIRGRLKPGPLSPRHRRLAEMIAAGETNAAIKEQLHYTSDSRVSVLRSDPQIVAEVERISEIIFEEGIAKRLKSFADPAMNVVQECLTDRSNRWKKPQQAQMAQWVIEKLDGKATQKLDVGENMLGLMLDRLDALKKVGGSVATHRPSGHSIDVTPTQIEAPKPKTETDLLDDWVYGFDAAERKP